MSETTLVECADGRMVTVSDSIRTKDGRIWPKAECTRDDDGNWTWDELETLRIRLKQEDELSSSLYRNLQEAQAKIERLLANEKRLTEELHNAKWVTEDLRLELARAKYTAATHWLTIQRLDPSAGQGGG